MPWFVLPNAPEVSAQELRHEYNHAIEMHVRFMAMYGPRGPMRRLLEYGELDTELFALCGCVVTELTEEEAPARAGEEA